MPASSSATACSRVQSPEQGGGQARVRRWLRLAMVVYGAFLLGACLAVYGLGESFWPTTLILFGPRWVLAVPLALLGAIALRYEMRWGIALGLEGLLLLGPLWGLSIPWRRWLSNAGGEVTLRVLTWNVQSGRVEASEIARLLETEHPDLVVLVECQEQQLEFGGAWHKRNENETCLVSRWPIVGVTARDRRDVWEKGGAGIMVRYAIETKAGPVRLTAVHLETPREGLQLITRGHLRSGAAVLAAKNRERAWEAQLAEDWANADRSSPRIVAGDFNTPSESDLLRRHWTDYTDCFERAGFGFGHTKHTRTIGVRIDHVLASREWQCQSARVVPAKGSDHDPLIVDLHLGRPAGSLE